MTPDEVQTPVEAADGAAATQMRRNPYCFVVGCLRSGTTLLQRMLDGHPRLAVGYDCHFIPQAIKRHSEEIDPPMTPELLDRVRQAPRFARLGLPEDVPQRAAEAASTFGEFVSAVYTAFGSLHGKPLAGEKAPGYVRHLARLHALFPWARFIHLIRDGRDIALSVGDWGKGPAKLALAREEPVAAAALWWRRDVLAGRTGGAELGPSLYREVRYERLVAEPEASVREIAAFLDLPFDEGMVTFHEGKTKLRAARSAKAAWLPPTQGLRDWRSQMSPRDVQLFEALAGDVLSAVGYERSAERIPDDVRAVADRCRQWWEANMSAPGNGRVERPRVSPRGVGAASIDPCAGLNPYVFIVGCPRSGTTLLKRMVDAHPQIAITPETHWVPRCVRKKIGVSDDGLVTPQLVPTLLAYRKFANLKITRDEIEALVASGRPLRYADFVSAVFDLYARGQRKRLAGDKTPGYVQEIPLLHELWPGARIVHLIRDGRDVGLSVLDWDRAPRTAGRYAIWDEDRVTTAALWWERFVRLGREAGETLGPDLYCEVRYESLVTDPVGVSEALCGFLDLPYDEAMVRFHEGRTRENPALSPKKAWRPLTPGVRDWRTQMGREDVERFEAAAGGLLDALGYDRACPDPEPRQLEHASRLRDAFIRDPRLRRRRLPRGWTAEG